MTRQVVVYVALFVAYSLYYFTRKNYSFFLQALVDERGMDKGVAGSFGSAFEGASAITKFFGGVFVDTSSPTLVLCGSLAVTGASNFAILATDFVPVMVSAWALNGFFQSFGWAALVRIFLAWFPDPSTRGTWYSVLSTSQNAGAALAPLVLSPAIRAFGWTASLWIPGAVGVGAALLLLLVLRDAPGKGLVSTLPASSSAPTDASKASPLTAGSTSTAPKPTLGSVLREVVQNRQLWFMGLGYFGISILRSGIADWSLLLWRDVLGWSDGTVAPCLVALEVGGSIGGILAGVLSDRVFHGRRGPVMVVSSAASAVFCTPLLMILLVATTPSLATSAPLLHYTVKHASWLPSAVAALYFAVGVTSFAPHMLIGLAARELTPSHQQSTAGGMVKALGQVGGALAGMPMGWAASHFGWGSVIGLWMFGCAVAMLALVPMWNAIALDARPNGATTSAGRSGDDRDDGERGRSEKQEVGNGAGKKDQ